MMGIYTITCTINKRIYVGLCTDFKNRIKLHLACLRRGKHKNHRLQYSYSKYGEQSFEFEMIEEYPEELLCSMEHYWANLLDSFNKKTGFNIRPTNPNGRGGTHSPEVLKKMSEKHKGIPLSKKHVKSLMPHLMRLRDAKKGIPRSKETIEKMASSKRGKKQKPEHIKASLKGRMKLIKRRGYLHDDESRKRISDNQPNKKTSNEIIKDYKHGMPPVDIIKKYNLTYSTLYKFLNKNKIKLKGRTEASIEKTIKFLFKKIISIDSRGRKKEFSSRKEASKILKINANSISNVLKGWAKTAGNGYKFQYA